MSIIFNLFSIPPLACRLLPVLQFCPILRGSNFGWVLRSGHIFDSFYISPDWLHPTGVFGFAGEGPILREKRLSNSLKREGEQRQ